MKTLTTNKRKLNKYYNEDIEGAKLIKMNRIERFKQLLFENEFIDLFDGKKYSLFDEIVFKTVNTGVYHCNASTIKEKCKVGKTTLSEFNKNLKGTKQYIVARYRTRLCNFKGLIYIDVMHADFYATMSDLFNMNEEQANLYLGTQATALEAVAEDNEKHLQDEYMKQYATNEYQKHFYNFIKSLPINESLKKYAHKMAMKIDDDKKLFILAKNTFFNLVNDLQTKQTVLQDSASIVKVFNGAFMKSKQYEAVPAIPENKKPFKPAPFYDWINDRE